MRLFLPPTRYSALLLAERARPLRFALTGGLAGLVQLGLLAAMTHHGWPSLPANLAAFLLAAQLNFAVSTLFTWRDRRDNRGIGRRWLAFHACISGMAVLNMLVFVLARAVAPVLLASAIGIAAAAVGNFLLVDRLVFAARKRGPRASNAEQEDPAA
jgi:putative flippase GtrA